MENTGGRLEGVIKFFTPMFINQLTGGKKGNYGFIVSGGTDYMFMRGVCKKRDGGEVTLEDLVNGRPVRFRCADPHHPTRATEVELL